MDQWATIESRSLKRHAAVGFPFRRSWRVPPLFENIDHAAQKLSHRPFLATGLDMLGHAPVKIIVLGENANAIG
jgi:hypothetical protein